METGVLALNRFRVRKLMRGGDRRAAVLHGFLQNPEDFLWTILVGNTVVNFVIFSLGFLQLQKGLGRRPICRSRACSWWASFLFYILCELAPKTVFQRYPNRLCAAAMAFPFRWIHRHAFAPLVGGCGVVFARLLLRAGPEAAHYTGRATVPGSRDELRFVMQEAAPDLTREEKMMINRVLDLPNRRVRKACHGADGATSPAFRPETPMRE